MLTDRAGEPRALLLAALWLASGCGGDGGSGPSGSSDAPLISSFTITPSVSAQPGDTITLAYSYSSTVAGIARTQVTFAGAYVGSGPSFDEPMQRSGSVTRRVRIPSRADLSDLVVRVQAVDSLGRVGPAMSRSLELRDITSPTVTVTLFDWHQNEAGAVTTIQQRPGDTLRIDVRARDNSAVRWIGYRLGAPANKKDSVQVTDSLVTGALRAEIKTGWTGMSTITAFARDASGNLSEVQHGQLSIYSVTTPQEARSVAVDSRVRDVAYDGRRNILFLSQPDRSRIAVLSLASMTFQAPIDLPTVPAGLDLSAGSDSLVISLPGWASIGVLSLVSPGAPIDTIHLTYDPSLNRRPDFLRVAGNDHVVLTLTVDGPPTGGQIITYDLWARAQNIRADAGYSGDLSGRTLLMRLADRSKVLLHNDGCCRSGSQLYDAPTNSFSTIRETGLIPYTPMSSDLTGSKFLLGNRLFEPTLAHFVTVSAPFYSPLSPSALSLDGSIAYLATSYGIARVRISDNLTLGGLAVGGQSYSSGDRASWLLVPPDGGRLILIDLDGVTVVRIP